ncbi:MAG: YecA family protein, partial [Acidimicrobiales bacterium]
LGREIVANQIFADDPTEVWSTAQRLLALGCDRERVFHDITTAFAPVMQVALERGEAFDPAAYADALARLPLPTAEEIERAMIEVVRSEQGIVVDELVLATLDRIGLEAGDGMAGRMVDHVMDRLVDDLGPLAWVAGDRTVHVGDLTAGMVSTHRLTADERDAGSIDASCDLAGVQRVDELVLPTGEPIHRGWPPDGLGWTGPQGWLEQYTAGSVLAVEVTPGSVVHITELATDPTVDAALVERVRAVYDREVEEPWLPVRAEYLVLAILVDEPASFGEARPPLAELCAAAGLERRLDEVAHDGTVWHNEVRSWRTWRVMDALGDDTNRARKVLRALDTADLLSGIDMSAVPDIDGPADSSVLSALLADLRDEQVLMTLAEELFERDEPGARTSAAALVDALLGAASQPRDRAVARLLAALHAERSLEPLVAEQHLHLAHQADAGFGPVIDRLAWYASDRGDAAKGVRLWRQLEPSPGVSQDLREVERFSGSRHPSPGRNDPCWCGSGRKYKQCHLGMVDLAPLPDRVGWLCRKAVAFLERRGHRARVDVLSIALARAVDPGDEESVVAAFGDPIVMDLALAEGGWFQEFLEARGELLPDDEALLAHSWELVDRTVYEVLAVRPGEGLDLRDLRTGDRIAVRERTLSRETREGVFICGRAVPDGQAHQLIGGVVPVPPGRERQLLDLLDDADPEAIAGWVAGLYRLPVLHTREGEASVECELVVDVGDRDAALAFLDATYDPDETTNAPADAPTNASADAWVELFPLNDDEQILRAQLTLDGSRVSVSTTSEERADRVLSTILGVFPAASVLTDRRTPLDIKAMLRRQQRESGPAPGDAPHGDPALHTPEVVALLEETRDRFEQRWCDESIPALSGLTPRQAAQDPTRRDELIRLIASFEGPVPDHAVTMRPDRLRELLDL